MTYFLSFPPLRCSSRSFTIHVTEAAIVVQGTAVRFGHSRGLHNSNFDILSAQKVSGGQELVRFKRLLSQNVKVHFKVMH